MQQARNAIQDGLDGSVSSAQTPSGAGVAASEDYVRRLEMFVNNTPNPISYIDRDWRYVFANNRFLQMIERTREQVIGQHINNVRRDESLRNLTPLIERALAGQRCMLEWAPLENDGSRRWVRSELFPDKDPRGNVVGVYMVGTDIHDLKLAHDRVRALANTDALTGLPNRPALRETIDQKLRDAAKLPQEFAVLFIDLDGFKSINDRHGHRFGDSVIIACAKAIAAVMREQDFIGRLAGDEFMAMLADTTRAPALVVATRVINAIASVSLVEGQMISLSASVGLAMFPEDGSNFDGLFKASDAAMYVAKQRGKNQVFSL